MIRKILIFFALGLSIISCKKEDDNIEPIATDTFSFNKPSHFPEPDYKFENNSISEQKFQLGRLLFYDPILSLDSTVSCATCHAQEHAFADHNIALSAGVDGTLGKRNSPALSNLAWYPNFMWDGGINHIETFSVGPITNMLEMKETIPNVLAKLNNNSFYKEKFKVAFNIDVITDEVMLKSLAQFMGMMISYRSKYDNYLNGKEEFSESELKGYQLFQSNCASCHKEPLTTNFSYQDNGIDSVFADEGRALITLNTEDKGKFKVPSLRNVALTYPYMHDGRFLSLDQVINHYSEGVLSTTTVAASLKGGLNFTNEEKYNLKLFLKTLTDYYYIGDPNFAPPSRD